MHISITESCHQLSDMLIMAIRAIFHSSPFPQGCCAKDLTHESTYCLAKVYFVCEITLEEKNLTKKLLYTYTCSKNTSSSLFPRSKDCLAPTLPPSVFFFKQLLRIRNTYKTSKKSHDTIQITQNIHLLEKHNHS